MRGRLDLRMVALLIALLWWTYPQWWTPPAATAGCDQCEWHAITGADCVGVGGPFIGNGDLPEPPLPGTPIPGTSAPATSTATATGTPIALASLRDVRIVQGRRQKDGSQLYEVSLYRVGPTAGIDLVLGHPATAHPGDVRVAGIGAGCTASSRAERDDTLHVSIACATPLVGSGVVLQFGLSRSVPVRDLIVWWCQMDERPCK